MKTPDCRPHHNPAEDWLDQLLREDARTHIDDCGFTDKLMQHLPPPGQARAARFQWRRYLPVILALAGAWVALGLLPGSDVFLDGAADLIADDVASPRVVAMVGTLLVFLGAGVAAVTSDS